MNLLPQYAGKMLQENKQQQNPHAEKTDHQDAFTSPCKRSSSPSCSGETISFAKHNKASQRDRSLRAEISEHSSPLTDVSPQKRKKATESISQQASLFKQLSQSETSPALTMPTLNNSHFPDLPAKTVQTLQSSGMVNSMWQQLQTSLISEIDKQPNGPVSLTLLLPKLGSVDARIAGTSDNLGWDISLRFTPKALAMIAPHYERCCESLRKRTATRVRLHFEQRESIL